MAVARSCRRSVGPAAAGKLPGASSAVRRTLGGTRYRPGAVSVASPLRAAVPPVRRQGPVLRQREVPGDPARRGGPRHRASARRPPRARAYVFVYTFHMPVFIVITGYFSRNFTFSGGKARKLITNLRRAVRRLRDRPTPPTTGGGREPLRDQPAGPVLPDLVPDGPFPLAAVHAGLAADPLAARRRGALSLLSGMSKLPDALEMNRASACCRSTCSACCSSRSTSSCSSGARPVLGALTLVGGLVVAFAIAPHMKTEWIRWRSTQRRRSGWTTSPAA